MPTQKQSTPPADTEAQRVRLRESLIGGTVLQTLGQPDALQRVQVRPLWEHHFRVNVLVGADAACARVAHSYFLVTDGGGNILTSTPAITRQYKAGA